MCWDEAYVTGGSERGGEWEEMRAGRSREGEQIFGDPWAEGRTLAFTLSELGALEGFTAQDRCDMAYVLQDHSGCCVDKTLWGGKGRSWKTRRRQLHYSR